jgi:hypothetical protein
MHMVTGKLRNILNRSLSTAASAAIAFRHAAIVSILALHPVNAWVEIPVPKARDG